jgi:DNA-binding response OmpR family regulator
MPARRWLAMSGATAQDETDSGVDAGLAQAGTATGRTSELATEAPPRRRLLLVEDDRPTYSALRGILSLKGWDVRVATSVREGLEAATDGPYSAVVLDLMLPDGQGEAVLSEFRQRWGDSAPVVVTTGLSDPPRIEAVSRMGVAAVLRKPIHLADLLGAIRDAP